MQSGSALRLALLSIAVSACGVSNPTAPSPGPGSPWRPPVRLGPTEGRLELGFPAVASDAHGRAIAVWVESVARSDRAHKYVRAARFDPTGQWGPSQIVGELDPYAVGNPRLVANDMGDAALVWSASRVALFSPDEGWTAPFSTPGPPEDPRTPVTDLRVSVAPDGTAMAVWSRYEDNSSGSWRQRLSAAPLTRDGWGPPTIISDSRAPQYSPMSIGMDGVGNATAIWLESGRLDLIDEPAAVWANFFENGRGWGRRQRLGGYPHTSGGGSLLTDVDADGHAIAVWEDDGGYVASVHHPDGWTAPAPVGAGRGFSPHVKLLPGGDAVVAWASDVDVAQAVVFEEGRGWSAPVALVDSHQPDTPGRGGESSLGMDAAGRAWIVWTDGVVQAARFSASQGWERPWALQTTNHSGSEPQVAVSPRGEAFAVWNEEGPAPDYRDEVWAAVYVPDGR